MQMRSYRSKQFQRIENPGELPQVCGVPVLPLAAGSCNEGPCSILNSPDFKDIVSEAIEFFRFNMLLKNRFDLHSPADKLLVYLTLWVQKLVACASSKDNASLSVNELEAKLLDAARSEMPVPGDSAFQLAQFFDDPGSEKERVKCSKYLRQLRIETARRLVPVMCSAEGGVSKWWQQYADVSFLGNTMT